MFDWIFKTATFKQSQITILGTIINGILGALFYILVARFLGPSDFGLLTVSIITLILISDIVDFGTNTGLIRFVSSYINSDKEKAFKFLKLGLEIKFLIWLTILLIGIYFSPFIAEKIFRKEQLAVPLKLVMFGVGGALFFSFATSTLQSFQKYYSWSFINISSNLLRVILIFVLFFGQSLTLLSGLIVYILLPFFGFFVTLLLLPTRQILLAREEFSVASQFFKFNTYIAIFTIIAAVSSRLDTFLSTYFLTTKDVGIYGAANQLTQIIPQIVGALGVVTAPKFASFQSKNDMLSYFKKLQLMVLGLSLVILLAIPIASFAIPFLYGASFTESITPFIILLLAMIIFLVSVPVHNSIIFYFGRSDIFVWVAIFHLLLTAFLGYFLISNFGVIGTSITVLIGMISNFVLPYIWFIFHTKT